MAEICCGVINESDSSVPREPSSRVAMRWRMELPQFKFVGGVSSPHESVGRKRRKTESEPSVVSPPRKCEYAVNNYADEEMKLGRREAELNRSRITRRRSYCLLGRCPKHAIHRRRPNPPIVGVVTVVLDSQHRMREGEGRGGERGRREEI
ncbi:hypothetical protein ACLOJK_025268 [Asimina triloba]